MSAAPTPKPTLQLKALSVGELLDYATKLYKDNFLVFFTIAGLAEVISFASLPLLSLVTGTTPSAAGGEILFAFLSLFVWWLAFLIMTVLSQAATTFAVADCYFERPITALQSYRRAGRFLGRLIRLGIEVGLRIGFATLALVVPGILLTLKYSVAVPVAVLEDKPTNEAIARSSELTKGEYKRIFPIYVLFWVLGFIFSSAVQYLAAVGAVVQFLGPVWLEAASLIGRFIVGTMIQPLLTISLSLLYFDLRVRKEGFDLQMMLQQISEQSPVTTPVSLPPVSPTH